MLLSQKLHELRELINEELCFSGPMSEGFNRCIEDAERLEGIAKDSHELEMKIHECYKDDTEEYLLIIGEITASHFGYL